MNSSWPASLGTLKVSVPPAVKLAAACGARPALDLDDFVACYNPKNSDKSRAGRHERKPADRFRSFTYEELTKRDKLNLDIFWLKDESLEDSVIESEASGQMSEVRKD